MRVGWKRAATFYINDKEVMKITFVDPLDINIEDRFDYYDIVKGNLDPDKFEEFLKSIDPRIYDRPTFSH